MYPKVKNISALLLCTLFIVYMGGCVQGDFVPTGTSEDEVTFADSKGEVASNTQTPELNIQTNAAGLYENGELLDMPWVFSVDGNKVPFDTYRYYYITNRQALDGGDISFWQQGDVIAQNHADTLKEYVRLDILTTYAINQLAQEHGLELVQEDLDTIDDVLNSAQAQLGGEEMFEQWLTDQNMTKSVYTKLLSDNLIAEKLLSDIYANDLMAEIQSTHVRAQHILILFADPGAQTHDEELARAEDVLQKVKDGEDFEALMKEYSEDMAQTPDGYYFTFGDMMVEFEQAAFALEEGETSDIVQTAYGYHIVRRMPMDDDYITANLSSLALQTDTSERISADMSAIAQQFLVEYHENYEKIAPDTIK